jgi:hypothetical protein
MPRAELIDRIVDVLGADDRVRAVWLSGSLGRGGGDEFSDVDLLVAVEPDGRDAFVAGWEDTVTRIAPIVHRQRLEGGGVVVFTHVTDEWDRFDATIVTPPVTQAASELRVLLDRADLHAGLPAIVEWPGPSSERVAALATEFLRVLGLLPVVVGRAEYVVGASGAGLLRGLIIQVMLEDAPDRGGALRLRGVLPDDRLAALAALPPIEATRESVLGAHLACAALFLPLAKTLAGDAFPNDLELALRRHLRRTLGLEI